MSLELSNIISEAHLKTILCVQCNPYRHELYTAGEDSIIKVWDSETGKMISSLSFHTGWVTSMLLVEVNKTRVLFSISIDGFLVAWNCQSGKIIQKIQTGSPIYSLAFNSRRQQLLAGYFKKVRVFPIIQSEDCYLNTLFDIEAKPIVCSEHQDVVSCMVSCEGRYYSGGYDRKIIIYDLPHHGDMKLKVSRVIKEAHDAAITCMIYGKDADNSWLITGSFDRVVKLWALDGTLLQRFDGFSLTYVLPTQTLWISANSAAPVIYDPRSGINVTDHTTANEAGIYNPSSSSFSFQQFLFIPETNQIIGITNAKSIIIWKFNQNAAISVLGGHTDSIQCLTFTAKEPVLLFSGSDDGSVRKYERLQLNSFMYSQETLSFPKDTDLLHRKNRALMNDNESVDAKGAKISSEERRRNHALRHKQVSQKLESWKRSTISIENMVHGKQIELVSKNAEREFKKAMSRNSSKRLHQSLGKTVKKHALDEFGNRMTSTQEFTSKIKPSILSLFYYEELDIIITGNEDFKMYVFGYSEEAVVMTDSFTETIPGINTDSVTNRVAGMSLKYTLKEHKNAVTGLTCFFKDGSHWLLSTGWDRRICLWDLKEGRLHDIFRNSIPRFNRTFATSHTNLRRLSVSALSSSEELCADDIVLGIEYASERGEFAYCSADKLAYIRKFSPNGSEMTLAAVLQGHEAAVTHVKWCKINQFWITASSDRTIRIWPADGIPCLKIINNESPITALCIDILNGCIISGAEDHAIRVFDTLKSDEVVQKNVGHTDEISSIVHVAVRNQYVSGSWDKTLRVWNAYIKNGQRKGPKVRVLPTEDFDQRNELKSSSGKGISSEEITQVLDQARLEEDLQTVIDDMEHALDDHRGRIFKLKMKPAELLSKIIS